MPWCPPPPGHRPQGWCKVARWRLPIPAAPAAAGPKPKAQIAQDRRLRLEDVLKLMVADGLVAGARGRQGCARAGRPRRASARIHRVEALEGRESPPHTLLTLDWIVEWLAGKLGVPYLHIDPLKIDLTAVTQTMSNAYAERFRILPVEVNRSTLTVATAEPFVRSWADELEPILKLEVKLVFANPVDIRRYLGEFYNLARSMKKAQETSKGQLSLAQQFRAAGRARPARQSRRQRQSRRPHRRLAVAVRVRAARLRHPRRAAPRRRADPLSHRRRPALGLRDPDPGADRGDIADQAPGADGDRREAPPAGRPHQDGDARRQRGRAAHLDDADGVRREGRDAHLHAGSAGARFHRARLHQRRPRALGADDQGAATASSSSPGRPAPARRRRSTRR